MRIYIGFHKKEQIKISKHALLIKEINFKLNFFDKNHWGRSESRVIKLMNYIKIFRSAFRKVLRIITSI